MHEVTRILSAIEQGDPQAAEQLLPLLYEELRRLAAEKMAHEKPGQTLEPTALLHEAYIRLVDVKQAQRWRSRGHFFAAAAEAMRRILVDNARRKRRLGGMPSRREASGGHVCAEHMPARPAARDGVPPNMSGRVRGPTRVCPTATLLSRARVRGSG